MQTPFRLLEPTTCSPLATFPFRVYIVRIRGERHSETQSKLHHIVNSLFPKNQKFIVPKDAPVNIFVRIIQFIAHEKLEFAVKEIIIDRLGVNGLQKNLYMPERMNIGLCAFLLIAHGLQQKEGAPPMPQQSIGGGGGGGGAGLRQTVIKRSFHGTNLNDALGHILGIQNYLSPIRRAFELILRQLDSQVCRSMMLSKPEVTQKEVEELMTAERKPKMDLLKTCVACIPRLLPNDMTKPELLELLAKICLHVDEDVRKMAQQAMANLIVELPAFRVKTIQVFIQFIQKNIADTNPTQLDSYLKTLFHLLNNWNLALQKDGAISPNSTEKAVLYEAEGFALVMLCHCRTITRRLAVHILRKCRSLLNLINMAMADSSAVQSQELCCIDVLDRSVPAILESVLPQIPPNERHAFSNPYNLDFFAFAERSSPIWLGSPTPLISSNPVALPAHLTGPPNSGLLPMNSLRSSPTGRVSSPQSKESSDVVISKDTRCAQCGMFVDTGCPGHTDVGTRIQEDLKQPGRALTSCSDQAAHPTPFAIVDSQNQEPTTHFQHSAQPNTHQGQSSQQAYVLQPVQERIIIGDIWATCLSIAFSPSRLISMCPQTVKYAWNVLFQRLTAVFPFIDPSAQIAENRASSILRSSSKKPSTERDQLLPLWHNYAVLACCIAPSSTGLRVSKPYDNRYLPKSSITALSTVSKPVSRPGLPTKICGPPDNVSDSRTSAMHPTPNTSMNAAAGPPQPSVTNVDSKSHTSPVVIRDTARDLVKLLVPLLRCEQSDIRDSAVGALGRINPASFRDVLEELSPLLRESVDRKQENVRRRRRRDILRVSLIRVLALMSQTGLFAYPESNALTSQGCLIPQLTDYLDGMRVYLDSVSDQATSLACIGVTGSPNVIYPSVPSTASPGSLLMGAAGSITPMTSSFSSNAGSAPAITAVNAASGISLNEASVLTEIRLHFSIFILELIRHLPKEKRTQLLPTAMRYQLFLLLSHWSGYHDHVMGLCSEVSSTGFSILFTPGNGPSKSMQTINATSGSSPVPAVSYSAVDSSSQHGLCSDSNQSALDANAQLNIPVLPQTYENTPSVSASAYRVVSSASQTNTPTTAYPPHTIPDPTAGQLTLTFLDSWALRLWTDLLWSANQAMGALLTCGPIYDQQALFNDSRDYATSEHSSTVDKQIIPSPGYVLRWISDLLVARDSGASATPWLWYCPIVDPSFGRSNRSPVGNCYCPVYGTPPRTALAAGERRMDTLLRQLGEETLVLLLDLNQASPALLTWSIEQCYTASNASLSEACFASICRVIANIADFPCDLIPLLVLAFVHLNHPQKTISDRAFYLLHVIYYRFVIKPSSMIHERMHSNASNRGHVGDSCAMPQNPRSTSSLPLCVELKTHLRFWQSFTRWAPSEVIRQFAAQHPDLTLEVFSEITKRLEVSRECWRVPLLHLLVPWIVNIELVDLISGIARAAPKFACDGDLDATDPDIPDAERKYKSCHEQASKSDGKRNDDPTDSDDADEHLIHSNPTVRKPTHHRSAAQRPLPSQSTIGSDLDSDTDLGSGQRRLGETFSCIRTSKADTVPLAKPNAARSRRAQEVHRRSVTFPTHSLPSEDFWFSIPLTLRCNGWGSKQSTELILNNLFYLTLRLAECPTAAEALKQVWVVLIRHRPANLSVILRYIIILTSLAPASLLTHAKRLVTSLASEQPESVVEELMVEMQLIDGLGLIVERTPTLPFFRVSTADGLGTAPTVMDVVDSANRHSLSPPATVLQCQQGTALDDTTERKSALQSVDRELVGQIDPELVAIGLGSRSRDKPSESTAVRSRKSALPFVGNQYPHADDELNTAPSEQPHFRRPKSAVGQSSTTTVFMENGRNALSGDAYLHVASQETSTKPSTFDRGNDEIDPELDVDAFGSHRTTRLSPEDKYATLRAKDLQRLLSAATDTCIEEVSESDCVPLRTDAQVRSGTLPTTQVSRERYLIGSRLSKPAKRDSSDDFDPLVRSGTRYSKRAKVKTRSQPRLVDRRDIPLKVPPQTVSLPPSLARLSPLILPLPFQVPSLSNMLVSEERVCRSGSNSPQGIQIPKTSPPCLASDFVPMTSAPRHPRPLAMPTHGCYKAPLDAWLSEPLVIGGSVVFSGAWPTASARSPLVLLLAGALTQCPNIRVDWFQHLPLMLLCSLLGLDHCRALVQEECKQLLVSMLSLACSEQYSLRLLQLELESDSLACTHPSTLPGPRQPQYRLTLDGGPFKEKFANHLSSAPSSGPPISDCSQHSPPKKPNRRDIIETPCNPQIGPLAPVHTTVPVDLSPIPYSLPSIRPRSAWTGSTYSLISTATLIPGHDETEVVSPPRDYGSASLHPAEEESNHCNILSSPDKRPAGHAVWSWDERDSVRSQSQSTLHLPIPPRSTPTDCNATNSTKQTSVDRLVRVIARILALAHSKPDDAEHCLYCHHGPPHEHAFAHRLKSQPAPILPTPVPNLCVVARLSQAALNMGLSCPNRHYASRSLQIFRILGAHLDRKNLSHLLARLGETISDTNEELQGYVTELFDTLEAAVNHIQTKSDYFCESYIKQTASVTGQARTAPASPRSMNHGIHGEFAHPAVAVSDRRRSQRQSSSVNPSAEGSCAPGSWFRPHPPTHHSALNDLPTVSSSVNLSVSPSSGSADMVICRKPICRLPTDEQADLLCGIFWTGIFLLESDFEHEYLAGVRIVVPLIPYVCHNSSSGSTRSAGTSQISLSRRVEKFLSQLHLDPPFSGLLHLAIKGCSSANLVHSACQLLVSIVPFLCHPLVVPPRSNQIASQLSFPVVLVTLMPMLLTAWDEDPSTVGSSSNAHPGDVSVEQPSVLQEGFLGRGVCAATHAIPRTLGSWASTPGAPVRGPSDFAHSSVKTPRLGYVDSISFPGTCSVGGFGAANGGGFFPNTTGSPAPHRSAQHTPLRPRNPVCIQAASALAQASFQIDSERLACLTHVLRLYAAGTFSKDVDQWTKCIVCYLLDGYTQYISHVLLYLTTLLTTGPLCLKRPLLKMVCLFVEQVDLNTPDLSSTLQHFITSVTAQFLGTEFWTETMNILRVLVSRSSSLTVAPPPSMYTLSGLDPFGSGRVLDFAAAAAAVAVPLPESEPPHLELAGPVLDFSFNLLQEASLLAPQFSPAVTSLAADNLDSPTIEKGATREEVQLPDSELCTVFASSATVWDRPGTCQGRLRHRLYNLVGCYGLPAEHRLGAPRSPSVIFSQSTETLDPQLSVHSSSEATSMVDISNSDDIRIDETTSMEQAAVFRDLDTYLDAQLMNINFLGVPDGRLGSTSASASEDEPRRPWGVRGQSITCHQDLNDDTFEQAVDLLPTVRAPLPHQMREAEAAVSWVYRHRSYPAALGSEVSHENERISATNWFGPPSARSEAMDICPSKSTSPAARDSPPLVSLCDNNEGISGPTSNEVCTSSSSSPRIQRLLSPLQTDAPTPDNKLSDERFINVSVGKYSNLRHDRTSVGSDSQLLSERGDHSEPLSDLVKQTDSGSPNFQQTSLPTRSTSSVKVRTSPSSICESSLPYQTRDRVSEKLSSSTSLPQMVPTRRQSPTLIVYEQDQSPKTRPTTLALIPAASCVSNHSPTRSHRPSGPQGKIRTTMCTSSSGLTKSNGATDQLMTVPHRSVSMSNLTVQTKRMEPVMKSVYAKQKVVRSPAKRFPFSGVLSRLSSPLFKLHRSRATKRQSYSAENLYELTKPKVTFASPVDESERPHSNIGDSEATSFKGSCLSLHSASETSNTPSIDDRNKISPLATSTDNISRVGSADAVQTQVVHFNVQAPFFAWSAPEAPITMDQLAVGPLLTQLVDRFNETQAALYRIAKMLSSRNSAPVPQTISRLIRTLIDFVLLSCTVTEEVCSRMEPFLASTATHQLNTMMRRLLDQLLSSTSFKNDALGFSRLTKDDLSMSAIGNELVKALSKEKSSSDSVRQETVNVFYRAIVSFRLNASNAKTTNHSIPVADALNGVLDLLMREKWKSDRSSDIIFAYLAIPVLIPSDHSTNVLSFCTQLRNQLGRSHRALSQS
ncbi:unnamed protein product [Dicrocoelium dendriticum]|nr:unnamed protein product [Dicrocoelium dendriticum]